MFGKIIRVIIFIINIVAIFCLLMVLLGSVISPVKFKFLAYFSLPSPIIILSNVFFVIFWSVLKNKLFLFSFILLILSYPRVKNVIPLRLKTVKEKAADNKKTFSILSYNTMINAKLVKHTKEKPNPVVNYILEQRPDIFCIQEFKVMHQQLFLTLRDVLKAFEEYPHHYISYPDGYESGEIGFGVATFSKYPIVNAFKLDFSGNPNSAHCVDIKIDEDTIRLLNNHLESNRLTQKEKDIPKLLKENIDSESISEVKHLFTDKLGVAYRTRAKQADVVAAVIKDSPYKVIAVGDLNDVPLSYAYSTVKGHLSDAFTETGRGFGYTYHDSVIKFRIDYIFHDDHFTVNEFKIDKVYHSDHYPVLCKLTIK
ncbi:MAG: endonuclease/exonuclease/phosphatase family protein [Prevotellaceae bacterium]|jgi:endonuclease/exonuclease/phosphatase family metal-dependent hydrolase|nr:endonuclease/exonuclease/phosphatase family protein [Prevotellaceae bacterium]